jgi:2-haloacid dehalogenase
MTLDFNRFEILTFDCYGTLIDWETGLLTALRSILSAHGKKIDDAAVLELYGNFEQRSEHGAFHPYREVLQSVVKQFGEELGFVPTPEEVRSLPDSLAAWKPWPDTVTALRQLKRRYRLAILSNVDDDLFATTRPQLEVEFDEVITAQQAQAYKPSLKSFEFALARIQAPAHRLGLATVWVNRPSARAGVGAVKAAHAEPDLEVSSLAELSELAAAAFR